MRFFFPSSRRLSLALLWAVIRICTFSALKADRCGDILIFFAVVTLTAIMVAVQIWTAKLPLTKPMKSFIECASFFNPSFTLISLFLMRLLNGKKKCNNTQIFWRLLKYSTIRTSENISCIKFETKTILRIWPYKFIRVSKLNTFCNFSPCGIF